MVGATGAVPCAAAPVPANRLVDNGGDRGGCTASDAVAAGGTSATAVTTRHRPNRGRSWLWRVTTRSVGAQWTTAASVRSGGNTRVGELQDYGYMYLRGYGSVSGECSRACNRVEFSSHCLSSTLPALTHTYGRVDVDIDLWPTYSNCTGAVFVQHCSTDIVVWSFTGHLIRPHDITAPASPRVRKPRDVAA